MKQGSDILNIHAILPSSCANGPGNRTVIWVQGCNLRCPGCFNPETHSHEHHHLMTVDEVYDHIIGISSNIQGITISGGEPIEQIDPVTKLLHRVRFETSWSIIVFSGCTLKQIENIERGTSFLRNLDVLIAGPWVERFRSPNSLRASSNQQIHLLTDRYSMKDIDCTPTTEVQIDREGKVYITGIEHVSRDSLLC